MSDAYSPENSEDHVPSIVENQLSENEKYDSDADESMQDVQNEHADDASVKTDTDSESSANDSVQAEVKEEPVPPVESAKRKRKVLDSDSENEEAPAAPSVPPPQAEAPAAQAAPEANVDVDEEDDDEEEKKSKKKKKKKKKKEKKKRRLKLAAETSASASQEQEDLNEEVDELIADAKRDNGSDDDDEENHVAAAVAAEAAKKSGEPDIPEPEWPDNDTEFEVLYRPINVIDSRALGAVLVYTVQMNEEHMRECLMEEVGDAYKDVVRDYLSADASTWHACNSYALFDALSTECGQRAKFDEPDVCKWRRKPELRLVKTLRKQWVYVMLDQSNMLGMPRDYSCAIGAYRLRVKGFYNELFGVHAGDFAAAACTVLEDMRQYSAHQIQFMAQNKALCLTKKEMDMAVMDEDVLKKFAGRETIDQQTDMANQRYNCLAFLPICAAKVIQLDVLGFSCRPRAKICERLPTTNWRKALMIRRQPRNESTAGGAAGAKKFLEVQPTYNLELVTRLMFGTYFDLLYFRSEPNGQVNVHLADFALHENDAEHGANEDDREVGASSAQFAELLNGVSESTAEVAGSTSMSPAMRSFFVRCGELAATPEVRNLCLSANSSRRVYRTRLKDALKALFKRALNRTDGIIDGRFVRLAWRKLSMLQARAVVSGDVLLTSDDKEIKLIRSFLRFFGDAFVDEDECFTIVAKAFGLRNARQLTYDDNIDKLYSNLQNSKVPYVVLFDSQLRDHRHTISNCIEHTFIPWLKYSRPEAFTLLLQRTGMSLEKVAEIVSHVMKCVSALDTVRVTDERSVVIASGLSEAEAVAYKKIVNVNESSVRVVSVGGRNGSRDHALFLLEKIDYFVEDALRTLLFNIATFTNLMASEEEADFERLVLLRGGNGDDVWQLVCKEFLLKNPTDNIDGERLLFVARDIEDVFNVENLCASIDNTNFNAVTAKELEAGAPDGKHWSEIYGRVCFFNAHRFSYDAMLQCVALLAGFESVPDLPLKMTPSALRDYTQWYKMQHGETPTENVIYTKNNIGRDIFGRFAERACDAGIYEKMCEENENLCWRTPNFRIAFAFVAYARPDAMHSVKMDHTSRTERVPSLEVSPHGNPAEDMYFGCVDEERSGKYWRVRELYSKTLAQQLKEAAEDGSVMFLPPNVDVNDVSKASAVQQHLRDLFRNGMEMRAPQELQSDRHKFARDKARAAHLARREKQAQLNFLVDGRYGACNITVPQWISMNNRIAPYTPQPWDKLSREIMPRLMSMQATRGTYTFATQEREVVRVRMTAVVCADPPLAEKNLAIGKRGATSHMYASDICGFGRTTVTEIMARLRFQWTLFVVVADTQRNFLLRCLKPNVKRTSVNLDETMPRLRACSMIEAERVDCPEYVKNSSEYSYPYYSCLQSSCAYAWQDATEATTEYIQKLRTQ